MRRAAALQLLARRAAGSMRDSQSLLEQLLAFVGDEITVSDVHAMLGTAREERLRGIVQPLIQRDAASALSELGQAVDEGVDPGQLAEQLVGSLRDMMVALVGGPGELLIYHAPSELDTLRHAGRELGAADVAGRRTDPGSGGLANAPKRSQSRLAGTGPGADRAVGRTRRTGGDARPAAGVARLRRRRRRRATGGAEFESATARKKEVLRRHTRRPAAMILGRRSRPARQDSSPRRCARGRAARADPGRGDQQCWQSALKLLDDITADFAAHASSVATSGPNRLVVHFPGDV